MNYREEAVKLLNSIKQESIVKFFYSLLRVVTSNPERYEESFNELLSE